MHSRSLTRNIANCRRLSQSRDYSATMLACLNLNDRLYLAHMQRKNRNEKCGNNDDKDEPDATGADGSVHNGADDLAGT